MTQAPEAPPEAPPAAPAETPPEGSGFTPITSQEQLNATVADRLRRQAAQYGATPQEVKAALEKLATFEAAQKTEAERAAEAVANAQKETESLRASLNATKAENALLTAAAGKLRVPSDAVLHLANKVEFDGEGNVTSDVGALVDGLLTERPDLSGDAKTTVPRPNPAQGTSGNGNGTGDPRSEFASFLGSALKG